MFVNYLAVNWKREKKIVTEVFYDEGNKKASKLFLERKLQTKGYFGLMLTFSSKLQFQIVDSSSNSFSHFETKTFNGKVTNVSNKISWGKYFCYLAKTWKTWQTFETKIKIMVESFQFWIKTCCRIIQNDEKSWKM